MTQKSQELVIYKSKDGSIHLDAELKDESIWLTQKQMGILFDKDTDTIGLHICNAFKEGELEESATTEESSVVQQEGKRNVRRKARFYNLDVIISVGYRVKSKRGTEFRIWAGWSSSLPTFPSAKPFPATKPACCSKRSPNMLTNLIGGGK